MEANLYNSEENTYVIATSAPYVQNIITENGKLYFEKDVSNLKFIIPGYVTFEEAGQKKLLELKTKRVINISAYSNLEGLQANKLIVGKNNNKFVLFNPATGKTLFESDKAIREINQNGINVPKNYFTLGYDNLSLVDITGKDLLNGSYKKFVFQDDKKTVVIHNSEEKQNYYNLDKKEFIYKKFFNDISKTKELTYIKYDKILRGL